MGLRYRRSIKIAPGVKINFNSKSTSVTIGPKGFKHTVSSSGRTSTTVSLPGTGLSYTSTSSNKQPQQYQQLNNIPLSNAISPRSKKITLLLCIFLGFTGIHRIFVGKPLSGVLWFVTFGLFGIGWIIDIILILTNNFRDMDGFLVKNN